MKKLILILAVLTALSLSVFASPQMMEIMEDAYEVVIEENVGVEDKTASIQGLTYHYGL